MKDETITIPSRITSDQFGAVAEFFNSHIKGQKFEVVTRSPDGKYVYFYINGEQFGIHVYDLIPDTDYKTKRHIECGDWLPGLLEGEEVKEAA